MKKKVENIQMKKIVVTSREEALKLISEGMNSMLVFSKEAPHGYKKDGTPAAPRGRKRLSEEVKMARKVTKTVRAKTGPVVRTLEAPHGVKKDGTPMLKRGRPTREQAEANRAAKAAKREVQRALRKAAKAERKAFREAMKMAKKTVVVEPIVTVSEVNETPVAVTVEQLPEFSATN